MGCVEVSLLYKLSFLVEGGGKNSHHFPPKSLIYKTPMMTPVLYIATSLDGYIARLNGAIDWLSMVEQEGEDYGYGEFYQSIDGLVMGRKTYEQVLGFGEWPYPDKLSVVLTRQEMESDRPTIQFTTDEIESVLQQLADKGMERIWIVGGGEVVRLCLQHRLVKEFIIAVIPILLGEGIPLFPAPFPDIRLTLLDTKAFPTGAVQLHYCIAS